jgi:hypothetical protein
MTDFTGTVGAHEIETATEPDTTFGGKTLRARLADLWPALAIGFGVLLTVAWTGGLSWLLLSLLLLVT